MDGVLVLARASCRDELRSVDVQVRERRHLCGRQTPIVQGRTTMLRLIAVAVAVLALTASAQALTPTSAGRHDHAGSLRMRRR
jgi:hypothetical protein